MISRKRALKLYIGLFGYWWRTY